jgi:hypothetical protein
VHLLFRPCRGLELPIVSAAQPVLQSKFRMIAGAECRAAWNGRGAIKEWTLRWVLEAVRESGLQLASLSQEQVLQPAADDLIGIHNPSCGC